MTEVKQKSPTGSAADAIIAAMVDPMSVVDSNGSIVQCNKAHIDTFGYSREETIGKKEEIIKVGPVRYLYRCAKCPRCTKTFLVKES